MLERIRAFSLIELMVVIAIVLILAAVAVPAYKAYVIRSKIAKFMVLMDTVRLDVGLNYNKGIKYTNQVYKVYFETTDVNKPAGLDFLYNGYYGTVDMRLLGSYFGLSANPWLLLVPMVDSAGIIRWTCSYHVGMDASIVTYLPASCQQVISRQIGFTSSNGLSYGADAL